MVVDVESKIIARCIINYCFYNKFPNKKDLRELSRESKTAILFTFAFSKIIN